MDSGRKSYRGQGFSVRINIVTERTLEGTRRNTDVLPYLPEDLDRGSIREGSRYVEKKTYS